MRYPVALLASLLAVSLAGPLAACKKQEESPPLPSTSEPVAPAQPPAASQPPASPSGAAPSGEAPPPPTGTPPAR